MEAKNKFSIRLINENDADGVLEIYKYYVDNTIASFEYEAPSLQEFIERIEFTTKEFPWLVCLMDEKIIGYVCAHRFRLRSAYLWSPESTIYLAPSILSKGIGTILYQTLFQILKLQGYYNVYAGVGLPNDKSERLHQKLGFEEIGVFKNNGYKHHKWVSTKWFHLVLTEYSFEPEHPKTIDRVKLEGKFKMIINSGISQLNNLR